MAKTSTSFKEGESGNSKGRPKGTPNFIGREGKEIMQAFLNKEFKKLIKNFEDSKLSDYQKWQIWLKLAEFVLPKLRAQDTNLHMDLSDEDVDKLAASVAWKHWEHVIKENDGKIKI